MCRFRRFSFARIPPRPPQPTGLRHRLPSRFFMTCTMMLTGFSPAYFLPRGISRRPSMQHRTRARESRQASSAALSRCRRRRVGETCLSITFLVEHAEEQRGPRPRSRTATLPADHRPWNSSRPSSASLMKRLAVVLNALAALARRRCGAVELGGRERHAGSPGSACLPSTAPCSVPAVGPCHRRRRARGVR